MEKIAHVNPIPSVMHPKYNYKFVSEERVLARMTCEWRQTSLEFIIWIAPYASAYIWSFLCCDKKQKAPYTDHRPFTRKKDENESSSLLKMKKEIKNK